MEVEFLGRSYGNRPNSSTSCENEMNSGYKRREAVTRDEKRLQEKRRGYKRREAVTREETRL